MVEGLHRRVANVSATRGPFAVAVTFFAPDGATLAEPKATLPGRTDTGTTGEDKK